MTALRRQGWRFLLLGGSNTVITFVMLAVLAHFIDHSVAYTIVFATGIAYTTALTGRFVFSAARSRAKTAAFVAWYLGVYAVGLLVVHIVDATGAHSGLAVALAVAVVTAPLGFLGGRLIYHRPAPLPAVDARPSR
jgi:putative flippase GtrA